MSREAELEQVMAYIQAHWPSQLRPEWQVKLTEYPQIAKRVVGEFVKNVTFSRRLLRVTGPSGSGKTTQILPAAEAYAKQKGLRPVLVAARQFVKYHPHYQEIVAHYGKENLRKMTDDFVTVMMFLTLAALVDLGADIILDVALLDPSIERILMEMLTAQKYVAVILMTVISPVVAGKFLGMRDWRHDKGLEEEFLRATEKALDFYSSAYGEMRMIMWSVYDRLPVYDGPVRGAKKVFERYVTRTELPTDDEAACRAAKVDYLTSML